MWRDTLADLLLPRTCIVCLQAIRERGRIALCARCEEGIDWIEGTACLRCGAPAEGFRVPPRHCRHCRAAVWKFRRAVCAGIYRGDLERAIVRFKYDRHPQAAISLAEPLARRIRMLGFDREVDTVTAVPSGVWSFVLRTYNPADEVAAEVARRLRLPMVDGMLRKVRPTARQAQLPRARRLRNPHGAYRAAPRHVRGRRVLLVDDVLTTGATASECAGALLRAGAADVIVACIARALK